MKGTVLLVLRKQRSDVEAFLDELNIDIKNEVKNQIESMQKLDNKEDPNFSDPDYVLAAYAASLKVLTGYKAIGEQDIQGRLLCISKSKESFRDIANMNYELAQKGIRSILMGSYSYLHITSIGCETSMGSFRMFFGIHL